MEKNEEEEIDSRQSRESDSSCLFYQWSCRSRSPAHAQKAASATSRAPLFVPMRPTSRTGSEGRRACSDNFSRAAVNIGGAWRRSGR